MDDLLYKLRCKVEKRDIYMSSSYGRELQERLSHLPINAREPPHVFLGGKHLGDADTLFRLNEEGSLARIL